MNSRTRIMQMTVGLALGGLLAGCAGAPRQAPVRGGPAETGPGSMNAVRALLEGTWTLASLQTFTESGDPRDWQAEGRLTYDRYGNLRMFARVTERMPGTGNELPYYTVSGRAVINTQLNQLILQDVVSDAPSDAFPEEVSENHPRQYEVDQETLKLSSVNEAGALLAITTWRRD